MSDWIGLGLIVALVALALVGMSRLGGPRKEMTVEEFEERARTGAYTRASMFAFLQLWHPKAVKTIEVQQDLKSGYYNKKRVPGDGDDDENQDGEGGKGNGERAEEENS